LLADIERLIKREIPEEVIPGFEPDRNAKPEPIQNGQNRGRGGPGRGQSSGRSAPRSASSGAGKPRTGAPGAGGRPGGGRPGGAPGSAKPAAPRRSGGRGR
jgi:ATP-dependent RNA helicase RhlE